MNEKVKIMYLQEQMNLLKEFLERGISLSELCHKVLKYVFQNSGSHINFIRSHIVEDNINGALCSIRKVFNDVIIDEAYYTQESERNPLKKASAGAESLILIAVEYVIPSLSGIGVEQRLKHDFISILKNSKVYKCDHYRWLFGSLNLAFFEQKDFYENLVFSVQETLVWLQENFEKLRNISRSDCLCCIKDLKEIKFITEMPDGDKSWALTSDSISHLRELPDVSLITRRSGIPLSTQPKDTAEFAISSVRKRDPKKARAQTVAKAQAKPICSAITQNSASVPFRASAAPVSALPGIGLSRFRADIPQHFYFHSIAGDGFCGPGALGIEREEVARVLLRNLNNPINMAQGNEIITQLSSTYAQVIVEEAYDGKGAYTELLEKHRDIGGINTIYQRVSLLKSYPLTGEESLESLFENKQFISLYINNILISGYYLPIPAIMLWAKLSNTNLFVFTKRNAGFHYATNDKLSWEVTRQLASNHLYLDEGCYHFIGLEQPTKYIVYNGINHYDRLNIIPISRESFTQHSDTALDRMREAKKTAHNQEIMSKTVSFEEGTDFSARGKNESRSGHGEPRQGKRSSTWANEQSDGWSNK
tara:strand:- start:157 stop:1935 length:1779 start_codon:yes stop_codon:yes gene_type:complete